MKTDEVVQSEILNQNKWLKPQSKHMSFFEKIVEFF